MDTSEFPEVYFKLSSTSSNRERCDTTNLKLQRFLNELKLTLNSSTWMPLFESLEVVKTLNIKGTKNFDCNDAHEPTKVDLQNILDTCFKSPNIPNTLRSEHFGAGASGFIGKSYSLTQLHIDFPDISASAWTFIAKCLPDLHFLELGLPNQNVQLGEMNFDRLGFHLAPHIYI
jgi:hypothetical protein